MQTAKARFSELVKHAQDGPQDVTLAFRQTLTDWLDVELPNFFVGRLLDIDPQVADRWRRLQASAGRTLPVIDGLLAATALQHDLTLVTRNDDDIKGLGARIINPWKA